MKFPVCNSLIKEFNLSRYTVNRICEKFFFFVVIVLSVLIFLIPLFISFKYLCTFRKFLYLIANLVVHVSFGYFVGFQVRIIVTREDDLDAL